MPPALAMWHWRVNSKMRLKPHELRALGLQDVLDLGLVEHLSREIAPARV